MNIAIMSCLGIVGPAVLRSVAGWAQNALSDGKISMIEWKQLGVTVIRVGITSTALYFGVNGTGIDIDALSAGFAGLIIDRIIEAVKDLKQKTKKK